MQRDRRHHFRNAVPTRFGRETRGDARSECAAERDDEDDGQCADYAAERRLKNSESQCAFERNQRAERDRSETTEETDDDGGHQEIRALRNRK